jgi:hypothetical protein
MEKIYVVKSSTTTVRNLVIRVYAFDAAGYQSIFTGPRISLSFNITVTTGSTGSKYICNQICGRQGRNFNHIYCSTLRPKYFYNFNSIVWTQQCF